MARHELHERTHLGPVARTGGLASTGGGPRQLRHLSRLRDEDGRLPTGTDEPDQAEVDDLGEAETPRSRRRSSYAAGRLEQLLAGCRLPSWRTRRGRRVRPSCNTWRRTASCPTATDAPKQNEQGWRIVPASIDGDRVSHTDEHRLPLAIELLVEASHHRQVILFTDDAVVVDAVRDLCDEAVAIDPPDPAAEAFGVTVP